VGRVSGERTCVCVCWEGGGAELDEGNVQGKRCHMNTESESVLVLVVGRHVDEDRSHGWMCADAVL
jgi:hypothetical protein